MQVDDGERRAYPLGQTTRRPSELAPDSPGGGDSAPRHSERRRRWSARKPRHLNAKPREVSVTRISLVTRLLTESMATARSDDRRVCAAHQRRPKTHHWWLSVALAAILLAVSATSATAVKVGCSHSSGESLNCVSVRENPILSIDQIRSTRTVWPWWSGICNYSARVNVYTTHWTYIERFSSGPPTSGCSRFQAWVDVWPRKSYWPRHRAVIVCSYFSVEGRLTPGNPCVTVRSRLP
jgi:hypothetical protein